MRNVFWYGCAVTATVVAGTMFLTAWWVDHEPRSLTAQCVQVAWHCAMEWNPVVQVGRFVGEKSIEAVRQSRSSDAEQCQAPAPGCPPADPGAQHTEPPVIEVIDVGNFEDLKPSDDEGGLKEAMPPEVVPPGAIEESEPVPPLMPPADDPELKVPSGGWCSGWMNLYREDPNAIWAIAEELPMPHEAAAADVEELPMPQAAEEGGAEEADAPAGVVPDCRETPDGERTCPECPASGCPAMKECPHRVKGGIQ